NVAGNPDFIVKVPNSADHKPLAEGETVRVGWKAADCRALDHLAM
ncbi:MAG: TOBE domain-containing protein, partial [Pseudomonadota bacterium]